MAVGFACVLLREIFRVFLAAGACPEGLSELAVLCLAVLTAVCCSLPCLVEPVLAFFFPILVLEAGLDGAASVGCVPVGRLVSSCAGVVAGCCAGVVMGLLVGADGDADSSDDSGDDDSGGDGDGDDDGGGDDATRSVREPVGSGAVAELVVEAVVSTTATAGGVACWSTIVATVERAVSGSGSSVRLALTVAGRVVSWFLGISVVASRPGPVLVVCCLVCSSLASLVSFSGFAGRVAVAGSLRGEGAGRLEGVSSLLGAFILRLRAVGSLSFPSSISVGPEVGSVGLAALHAVVLAVAVLTLEAVQQRPSSSCLFSLVLRARQRPELPSWLFLLALRHWLAVSFPPFAFWSCYLRVCEVDLMGVCIRRSW